MCGGAPDLPIVTIFGTVPDPADLINIAKFCIDRCKGFGLTRSQIWGFP